MGDFIPLCTQLYYVYFNLYYIWVFMGIYGCVWEMLSAPVYMTVKWDGAPVLFSLYSPLSQHLYTSELFFLCSIPPTLYLFLGAKAT